jgi:tellurite resistance protein TerC
MDLEIWMWFAFGGFVVAMLLIDLRAFGNRGETIPLRRAAAWSVGWTLLGLAFAAFLWLWQGRRPAEEYLTGFLIEKSLSIDNLFVFALIFAFVGVPRAYQRRVIYWGIVGAILLRGLFILTGATLLDAFHYTTYVFGAFLVITGVRMARHSGVAVDPSRNPALRLLRAVLPVTSDYHQDRMVVRRGGRWAATPMLAAVVLVATFDVVFAVDSIPAVFAVTRDVFIASAANAFSLLGLAALFFVLADAIARFRYLNLGLATVLVFVGMKMALSDAFEIPAYVSLAVVIGAVGIAALASLPHRPASGLEQRNTAADERRGPTAIAPEGGE